MTVDLVTVYTPGLCRDQSHLTLAQLARGGVPFVRRVLDPYTAATLRICLGFTATPVVLAGRQSWQGHQPDRIEALARED
jgi:hypothetical protein